MKFTTNIIKTSSKLQKQPMFQSWASRCFFNQLSPELRAINGDITEAIALKVTRAAARGITDALVNTKTKAFEGMVYEDVFNTVLNAVHATMDNPIHIKPDENGYYTSWDIFRRMGKNTWTIKEFTEMSVLKGKPFNVETVIEALRHTHLYSFTPEYKTELASFSKRNKGHQSYDLKQILRLEKQKEAEGKHRECYDEDSIMDPQNKLFTRWMEGFENNDSEKIIAKKMFDISTFTPGKTEDEVMCYVIGVWAGGLTTGLRLALTAGDPNGLFMGWGEGALWPAARLAVADANKTLFKMPPDKNGNHTRHTIINAYALSALVTADKLKELEDGHLHRNQEAYFHTLPEVREAIAKFLQITYEASHKLMPRKPSFIPNESYTSEEKQSTSSALSR